VEISLNARFEGDIVRLPAFTATHLAVRLNNYLDNDTWYFWRVVGFTLSWKPVEKSQQANAISYFKTPGVNYSLLFGLVKSDLDLAGLAAARVTVTSREHIVSFGSIVFTGSEEKRKGVYGIWAVHSVHRVPIKIGYTKAKFKPATKVVNDTGLEEIKVEDVVMVADSDGDGISDKVEKSRCLKENDADTDDDGIEDGDEDINKDGNWDRDLGETDPCNADSDGDGLSDKVEKDSPSQCLDANNVDTDGDGIWDGVEDTDKDGTLDAGETDPCDADSPKVGARALPAILKPLLLKD
jgi:hypothetical protein